MQMAMTISCIDMAKEPSVSRKLAHTSCKVKYEEGEEEI